MRIEIKEINGRAAADTVALFFLICGAVSVPIVVVCLAAGLKVNVPGGGDLPTTYLNGLLWTAGLWLTIRLNCWIYNKLAGRFGGLRFRVKNLDDTGDAGNAGEWRAD
jgi:hypothetical protein